MTDQELTIKCVCEELRKIGEYTIYSPYLNGYLIFMKGHIFLVKVIGADIKLNVLNMWFDITNSFNTFDLSNPKFVECMLEWCKNQKSTTSSII